MRKTSRLRFSRRARVDLSSTEPFRATSSSGRSNLPDTVESHVKPSILLNPFRLEEALVRGGVGVLAHGTLLGLELQLTEANSPLGNLDLVPSLESLIQCRNMGGVVLRSAAWRAPDFRTDASVVTRDEHP